MEQCASRPARWWWLGAAWLAVGLMAGTGESGKEPREPIGPTPGSIAELLGFASIPRPKPWTVHQASGYDRDGGFYDSGNFLRVESGRRFVLMESSGPGVIDRLWFTYKGELGSEPYDLLIYLDDPNRPALRENLDTLFTAGREPFVEPLAGVCGDPKFPGRYSLVPLGFRDSAKVVLQPTASPDQYRYRQNQRGERIPHVYYQVTYRRLRAGSCVRPFRWELEPAERAALQRWREVSASAGRSPWPAAALSEAVSFDHWIAPGETAVIFQREGPGTIAGLRVRTDQPGALELRCFWEGASTPAVVAPLGPFCATGESPPRGEVRGLWAGYADGAFYNHLPMPFHRSARVELRSSAHKPARVSGSVTLLGAPPEPDALELHAHRYDHQPPPLGQDYVVLDVRGAGHFAGVVMDRPGHMEGDDRFFVDGGTAPALHGTGTEDFFNFAWGLSHTAALPLHGITLQAGGPVAYRFHLPASVPFRQSLRILWEHGHDPEHGPNLDQGHYSGVVFFYCRRDAIRGSPAAK